MRLTAPYLDVRRRPPEESGYHGKVGVLVEAGDQDTEQQNDETLTGREAFQGHPT